jgi:MtaA/CmuA family methyltransferase
MTSKELVSAALNGLPTRRTPTGPLAVHYCARQAGFTLRQYTTEAVVLADAVLRYYERFKPDAVWLSADTWVSAEAMGATVGALGDDQPFGGLGEPLVKNARDIDRIPHPDMSRGRYALMCAALSRIVRALGNEAFVVACFDQYPFSLAAALMGINEIMLRLVDDPAFVEALMRRCEEFTLAYARALSDTGADLLSGGDSPAGLIGPALYQKMALPAETRVISQLKAATAKPVSLHICGNAAPILRLMRSSGADVLEIDHAVDLPTACKLAGPGVSLWGNLDPVNLLSRGTPQDVAAQVRQVLGEVRGVGHNRFVLSSGCTLAVETPLANLDAFFAAARE